MLPFALTLLATFRVSALALQLVQPTVPTSINPFPPSTISDGVQETINTSLLFLLSTVFSDQRYSTIALPLNSSDTSIWFSSLGGRYSSSNETFHWPLNVSAGPRPILGPRPLPPLPHPPRGWRYWCGGARYGTDLNGPSCLEAWSWIPPVERTLSFGPRNPDPGGMTTFDVGLPKRYLSCMFPNSMQMALLES